MLHRKKIHVPFLCDIKLMMTGTAKAVGLRLQRQMAKGANKRHVGSETAQNAKFNVIRQSGKR
ncbi:hypothetical protein CSE899_09852 [Cronobacter sakazakii E899]|nr:hypothetical protein CSE899_09852 [Cronobacter sakazakii E899]